MPDDVGMTSLLCHGSIPSATLVLLEDCDVLIDVRGGSTCHALVDWCSFWKTQLLLAPEELPSGAFETLSRSQTSSFR